MSNISYIGGSGRKTGAPALPTGKAATVHCLMIPLNDDVLLLPNAAIAEVSAYLEPERVPGAPAWYLGRHQWRDYQVPVIAFESLLDDRAGAVKPAKNSRIAILNTLNGNPRLPYLGVLAQGIPRLQVVQDKSIEQDPAKGGAEDVFVADYVLVNGEPATIPNIDMIERAILDLAL